MTFKNRITPLLRTVLILNLISFSSSSLADKNSLMADSKAAEGKFDVVVAAQQDADTPAGRMIIKKSYEGAMQGSGVGQMISKRTQNGNAAYYAIEEFSGVVDGKQGAFTLLHNGRMSSSNSSLVVTILEGSGSGELATISGSLMITETAGLHAYQLIYKL